MPFTKKFKIVFGKITSNFVFCDSDSSVAVSCEFVIVNDNSGSRYDK